MTRDELARVLDEAEALAVAGAMGADLAGGRLTDAEFGHGARRFVGPLTAACRELVRERDAALSVIATAERAVNPDTNRAVIDHDNSGWFIYGDSDNVTYLTFAAAVTAWGEAHPEVRDGE